MKTASEIRSSLAQFTGTEGYHRFSILFGRLVLTDGAKYLANETGAFWFMDIIGSYQKKCQQDEMLRDIQFWTLKVNPDKTATVICERDTGDIAFTQEIEHTDFPLPEVKVYCAPLDGEGTYTILLPSEY